MKKAFTIMLTVLFIFNFVLAGCGRMKASSPEAAIKKAQTIKGMDKRNEYLMNQAEAFFRAKDFMGAVKIAEKLTENKNAYNKKAATLIMKAKDALIVEMEFKQRQKTASEGTSATTHHYLPTIYGIKKGEKAPPSEAQTAK